MPRKGRSFTPVKWEQNQRCVLINRALYFSEGDPGSHLCLNLGQLNLFEIIPILSTIWFIRKWIGCSVKLYSLVDSKIQPQSWWLYFIRWEFLGTLSPKGSISGNAEKTALEERRWGEPGNIVLQQRAENEYFALSVSDVTVISSYTHPAWAVKPWGNSGCENTGSRLRCWGKSSKEWFQ